MIHAPAAERQRGIQCFHLHIVVRFQKDFALPAFLLHNLHTFCQFILAGCRNYHKDNDQQTGLPVGVHLLDIPFQLIPFLGFGEGYTSRKLVAL